jgi:hypothetical protein
MSHTNHGSHALEMECDISYNECPRSKGSIHLWIAVSKARDKYVNQRTDENRKAYQEAINKYAQYFSQEPIQIK